MATEFARTKYRVTGHNEPGLAGRVSHILEPVSRDGPPGAMNQPAIETSPETVFLKGTVIETVSTWGVVSE